ncbi:hypothetical protein [Vibrio sp. D431a]|uniref:hypothetical protein n=1 Tax=Vibrio sp. D431a TaxID=2837388 RepID=UPI002552A7D0|nr:hypothetical protein [Vibrio sp. D431a]MDK9789909.1 hypothetical protein [Vibrio sp. D431a]
MEQKEIDRASLALEKIVIHLNFKRMLPLLLLTTFTPLVVLHGLSLGILPVEGEMPLLSTLGANSKQILTLASFLVCFYGASLLFKSVVIERSYFLDVDLAIPSLLSVLERNSGDFCQSTTKLAFQGIEDILNGGNHQFSVNELQCLRFALEELLSAQPEN